jgi:hypothetical protein
MQSEESSTLVSQLEAKMASKMGRGKQLRNEVMAFEENCVSSLGDGHVRREQAWHSPYPAASANFMCQ